jgi:hypothetical protein
MASLGVGEFILVLAAIALGVIMIGYVAGVLIPQESFAMAQQSATNLGSSSTVSAGPLLINSTTKVGTAVFEFYNPGVSTNVTVIVFPVSSSLVSSVGQLVPDSLPQFTVYLPNGKPASKVTISSPVYDLSGRTLLRSTITAYTVPTNVPFTVQVQGISKDQVLVIWFLWNTGNNWFRVAYSFTGVPS